MLRRTFVSVGLVSVGVLITSLVVPARPVEAQGEEPVVYVAPVQAPVVDPFRPPPTPWAAGNRGLEFATTPGSTVQATARGVVAFAGPIGARRYISIDHPDGVRSTYSGLATIGVVPGEQIGRGAPIGTATDRLHFGLRIGDVYLDPAVVLAGSTGGAVRLIPDHDGADWQSVEQQWFVATQMGDGPGLAATIGTAAATVATMADTIGYLLPGAAFPAAFFDAVAIGFHEWAEPQPCTPAALQPAPSPGRRIVVLVAGLGSSSSDAAIHDLPTAQLGYAPTDVIVFSYAGGRVPPPDGQGWGPLASIGGSEYTPAETQQSLHVSADHLAQLVLAIGQAAPGVPIDVIAHSQGGVIATLSLALVATDDPGLPVEHLVTIGSPHQGAPAAAMLGQLTDGPLTGIALGVGSAVDDALGDHLLDPDGMSFGQLEPGSGVSAGADHLPRPEALTVTSIGSAFDLVVPGDVTGLAESTEVLVSPSPGDLLGGHGALPGDPEVVHEVALAIAGLPPGCRSPAEVFGDHLLAGMIAAGENVVLDLIEGPGPP